MKRVIQFVFLLAVSLFSGVGAAQDGTPCTSSFGVVSGAASDSDAELCGSPAAYATTTTTAVTNCAAGAISSTTIVLTAATNFDTTGGSAAICNTTGVCNNFTYTGITSLTMNGVANDANGGLTTCTGNFASGSRVYAMTTATNLARRLRILMSGLQGAQKFVGQVATTCAGATADGQTCWNTTPDLLSVGDGAALKVLASGDASGKATAGDSATAFFSTGQLEVAQGGTGADLSATGGANQFAKQSTVGGAFTVGAISDPDVPNTITLDNLTQITTRSHSSLTGLTVDDHTQYLLASGLRALTGDWSAGDVRRIQVGKLWAKGNPWFDVKAYGALGDGIADDTAAIAAAFTAACVVATPGTVFFPPGTYFWTGLQNLNGCDGVSVGGSGVGTTLLKITSATNDFFTWTQNLTRFNMWGISFHSSVARTAGYVLKGACAYTASCSLTRSRFENLEVRDQYNGFWIPQYEFTYFTNINMRAWATGAGAGIGFRMGQTTATNVNQGSEIYLNDVQIYGGSGDTGSATTLGIAYQIEDTDAVYLTASGSGGVLTNDLKVIANAGGHSPSNHFFLGSVFDATKNGHCIYFTGGGIIGKTKFTGSWMGSAGKEPAGAAGLNSLRVDAPTLDRMEFVSNQVGNSTGSGIYLATSGHAEVTIVGNNIEDNGSSAALNNNDGITLAATVTGVGPIIVGNHIRGNNGVDIRTLGAITNMVSLGNRLEKGVSLNTAIDVDAHNQGRRNPAVRAWHTVNQAVGTGGVAFLAFDSENFDTDTMHDLVTNNSRITFPTAGKYQITGCVEWSANATGLRELFVEKNALTRIADDLRGNSGGTFTTRSCISAPVYSFAANDYVRLGVFQDSGATINVVRISDTSPLFSAVRIAD